MHNNRTYSIIQHVTNKLFEPEYRRLQGIIDKIYDANIEAKREPLDGFMYQGKFYKPTKNLSFNGPGKRVTLHLNLWPDMEAFLADKQHTQNDRKEIEQLLLRLIDLSANDQHIRDAIPDCIADTLPPELAKLDRMGGPCFYDEKTLKQYNKILPKIEFYSATRMLY